MPALPGKLRSIGKASASALVASVDPRCRYDRCIFLLGHMRCGSTALSGVLCARPEIAGYGETHIAYDSAASLGLLSLNLRKYDAWKASGEWSFDKVLHNAYDAMPPRRFFESRAIFLIREPEATIRSIRGLFSKIGSTEYASDTAAANYYADRVERLKILWGQFPSSHRAGFTYAGLTADTGAALARISDMVGCAPPLENRYDKSTLRSHHGAGDPLVAADLGRIESRSQDRESRPPLDLAVDRLRELRALYESAEHLFVNS